MAQYQVKVSNYVTYGLVTVLHVLYLAQTQAQQHHKYVHADLYAHVA